MAAPTAVAVAGAAGGCADAAAAVVVNAGSYGADVTAGVDLAVAAAQDPPGAAVAGEIFTAVVAVSAAIYGLGWCCSQTPAAVVAGDTVPLFVAAVAVAAAARADCGSGDTRHAPVPPTSPAVSPVSDSEMAGTEVSAVAPSTAHDK